ncbi:MAG: hypothetical protein QMD16_10715 [Desulfitobacteriaceae bacterium]|nr:hypothetical protein [Desulfitobacteriaceae bacterium]
MERIKLPRSVFINYPLGHPCGKPLDVPLQTQILKDTLNFFSTVSIPGQIKDLPDQWGEDFGWNSYVNGVREMVTQEGGHIPDVET